MNKTWKVTAALILIGGSLWAGSLFNMKAEGAGVTGQPGTADDPVVTKSYVDSQIQQALNGGSGTTEIPKAPEESTVPTVPTTPPANNSDTSKSASLEIVEVRPGRVLIASAGTEFIVRSGKAVVHSDDKNGVADLTDGVDLAGEAAVTNNHLLLFPKDGRGVKMKAGDKYNLIVIVRGDYQVKSLE